jgi:hypothetical protein
MKPRSGSARASKQVSALKRSMVEVARTASSAETRQALLVGLRSNREALLQALVVENNVLHRLFMELSEEVADLRERVTRMPPPGRRRVRRKPQRQST